LFFKVIHSLDKAVEKAITWLLVITVLGMLFMSVSNIVLRWFDAHILWFEPAVRYLVFIAAFLGGAIATGKRTHIGIDLIGKYFESKRMWDAHRWVGRIIDIACIVVLVYLTKACIDFVGEEAKYGRENVFIGLHAKYLAAIIPAGFGVILYRFCNNFILSFSSVYRYKTDEEIAEEGES
jgi:TRAP-type C4-dicarboxylate transport system permease small subunit